LVVITPGSAEGATARGGRSLVWVLLPSVVLVMASVFMAVQVLSIDADRTGWSLAQRLNPALLAREMQENFNLIMLFGMMMTTGVLVALHIGLRPLRKISEQAACIGPATISRRLPLQLAPREVAPLVLGFNTALDRLEAGWRIQQEFSANAAHELRTPLATLRAQVESLLEPDERREAIEEFDRLSRLIGQLLTLAEADGEEDLVGGRFDLIAVARDLTVEMAGAVLAGGRDIAFHNAHESWECEGSAGLVEVALRNLLENAVRHTPKGCEILVAVDAGGCLAVSDNGPGVPAEFRDRLFRRFSKADAHGAGAGLGLSIVERIMARHGGEARLAPSPTGARFVLDFSARGQRSPDERRSMRAKRQLATPMGLLERLHGCGVAFALAFHGVNE